MDTDLNKLDNQLVHLLAWQRLQQLLTPPTQDSLSAGHDNGKDGKVNRLLSTGITVMVVMLSGYVTVNMLNFHSVS